MALERLEYARGAPCAFIEEIEERAGRVAEPRQEVELRTVRRSPRVAPACMLLQHGHRDVVHLGLVRLDAEASTRQIERCRGRIRFVEHAHAEQLTRIDAEHRKGEEER